MRKFTLMLLLLSVLCVVSQAEVILLGTAPVPPATLQKAVMYQAQATARGIVYAASTALTNNSGGTVQNGFYMPTLEPNLDPYIESGTTSVAKSVFDAWVGDMDTAAATLAGQLNTFAKKLGITPINVDLASGSSGAPTLAAVDTTVAAAAATLVDATTGLSRLVTIQSNLKTILAMARQIGLSQGLLVPSQAAIGGVANTTPEYYGSTKTVFYLKAGGNTGTAVAGTAGATTLKQADVQTYVTAAANIVATLGAYVDFLTYGYQASLGTGSGASGTTVTAQTELTAFTHASGTDLMSVTEFNTFNTLAKANMADLAGKINWINGRLGISSFITDDNRTAFDSTVASMASAVSLTGVTGTDSDGAPFDQVAANLYTIERGINLICRQVNFACDVYGVARVTNTSTVSYSDTLGTNTNISLADGVDGATAEAVGDTAGAAVFVEIQKNIDTLYDKINTLATLVNASIPPKVISQY